MFRSFFGVLLSILVLWSGIGILIQGDIIMPPGLAQRLLFLTVIVLVSAGLAWVVYMNFLHTVLSYDDARFELQQGRNRIGGVWRDFSDVSLFHVGRGQFVIRLYRKEDGEFEEIPVSTLKLNPSEFRFLAMKYVRS